MSVHTITFYLVRHGEAENNVRNILNSAPIKKEYSLTERGKNQVQKTAKYLSAVGADLLMSSPILRAKETAEIISDATGLPVIIDDRLWEVKMGNFNNKNQEEMLNKYPEPEMRLAPDAEDKMESFIQVRSRLDILLEELKEHHSGEKIILVSHSDPLEQLHGILTLEGPGRAAIGWYPETGSCTEMIYQYEKKES